MRLLAVEFPLARCSTQDRGRPDILCTRMCYND
jgi:hypothetical protein